VTAVLYRLRVVAVCAVLFAVPLIFWPWAREAYRIVKLATLAVFVLPALAMWFSSGRPGAGKVPRWYVVLAGLFLVWACARIPGAGDSTSALLRGGEWILTFCAAAAALGLFPRDRRAALDVLLASTTLAAVMGIAQNLFGRQFATPFMVDPQSVTFTSERVFSTFGNPIFFAGYLALVIPLTVGALAQAVPWSVRFRLLLASGLIQLIALVLTSARGAFIGLAVGMATLALLTKPMRRWIAGLAATTAVLVLVAALISPGLAKHLFAGGDPGRLLMWRTAVEMWKTAPLTGAGLGQFNHEYPCVQMRIAGPGESGFGVNAGYAHNDFLQTAAELGVPGAILFAALVAGLLLIPVAGLMGKALKAGVIAVAVNGLFNPPFHTIPVMVFVWMLAAFLLIDSGKEELPPDRAARCLGGTTGPRVIPAVLTLYVMGAVVAATLVLHPFLRSSYIQWALAYQDARMYTKAGDLFDRALLLMPDDSESRIELLAGKARFESGDLDGAKTLFERGLVRFPCYPEGYGSLGVIYGVKAQNGEPGALKKAYELVGVALRIRPEGKEAAGDYVSLGNLGVLEGNEKQALDNYLMAVKCDPGSVEAATSAVHLLLARNRRKEAASIVAMALRANPTNTELAWFARSLKVAP
jgi:O-antigen ligase